MNIVVAYQPSSEASTEDALRLHAMLTTRDHVTVSDLRVSSSLLPFVSSAQFRAGFEAAGGDTVFLCTDMDDQVASVVSVSRDMNALSMSFQEDVLRAGTALAIVLDPDGRHRILVNLPASRAEGVAFSPALLELAEIVR